MKKLLFVLPLLLLFGCNISEECMQSSGSMKSKTVEISAAPGEVLFTKIYVYPNISLVISQGDQYAITIKAGGNVIDDISAKIVNGALELRDNSGCNLARQYGGKTVYLTTPFQQEMDIYSNTAQPIKTEGVITHMIFRLFSMDYFGGVGTGDFYVNVDNSQLCILSNNVSIFHVNGKTNQMLLYFYDDLSRFEGAEFMAQEIDIFQRSANDMIIHPVQKLTGNIYSTGNVLCKTHPPVNTVEQHYTGRVIYVN